MNIFVYVVFNISMVHVSEFAIQGADRFVAPFSIVGSFQGAEAGPEAGVHQEQNYLRRLTKINRL